MTHQYTKPLFSSIHTAKLLGKIILTRLSTAMHVFRSSDLNTRIILLKNTSLNSNLNVPAIRMNAPGAFLQFIDYLDANISDEDKYTNMDEDDK